MPFTVSATDWERRVKVCAGCKQEKPFSEFYFSKNRGGGGIYARCKTCCNADTKAQRDGLSAEERDRRAATYRDWRQRTRSARRVYERERGWSRKYGLSPEGYDRLLRSQDGRCAICPHPVADGEVLVVDHDHETGEIRGLLCTPCNLGLSRFRDDPALLLEAIAYIRDPPARRVLAD